MLLRCSIPDCITCSQQGTCLEAARIGSRRAWLPCVTTQRGKCGPWQHIAHAWHTCTHRTYSESQRKPLPGVTAVGFEPTPFQNGALSHRLRPLGQTVVGGFLKTDIRGDWHHADPLALARRQHLVATRHMRGSLMHQKPESLAALRGHATGQVWSVATRCTCLAHLHTSHTR